MEQDEPRDDFLEEVSIGTDLIHWNADVVVTFDSRTGGFTAKNGYIVETTSERITPGTQTEITVKSNGGCCYVVIRKPGGVYEAKSWFTWVSVKKTRVN